jgi:5-methylcytosine-specific restriction endonuclease McrA
MNYDLTPLADEALLSGFASLVAQDCRTTAALLAHIAEIDARHLYLGAGFESMRAYCVRALNLTEDGAAKRIQVARLARELPALFPAIADGRLHLKAVRLLASRVTAANVDELVSACSNRSASEVELELARRFPQPELLRLDDGIAPQVPVRPSLGEIEHAPGHARFSPTVRTQLKPLSPERYTLQVTIAGETYDTLRKVQGLLGHAIPSGDVAQVIDRALKLLRSHLEKRKYGAQKGPRAASSSRAIPAHVRKFVYERDGGVCTYEGCGSTTRLEFDHIVPLARGGKSTASNLRLVCRAHNQWHAERTFGRAFMDQKRAAARL